MRTFNKLFAVWIIMAVLIFAGLCTLGIVYKGNIKKYKAYEDVLKTAAESYAKDEGILPSIEKYKDINIDKIIDKGYVSKKKIIDSCSGKVRITAGNTIEYTPIIKCKYYKSK